MLQAKVKAKDLRGKKKEDLTKQLQDLQEVSNHGNAVVSGHTPVTLACTSEDHNGLLTMFVHADWDNIHCQHTDYPWFDLMNVY